MTEKTSIKDHQFKITIATAVLVIIFIIGVSINFATWKTQMEADHERLNAEFHEHADWGQGDHEKFLQLIAELEDRQDISDVQNARIETQLKQIESLLIEIKMEIKEHETRG